MGAITYARAHKGGTPKAPEGQAWDAGKARRQANTVEKRLKISAYVVDGQEDNLTAYKFPHHWGKDPYQCVWRGVAQGYARLQQQPNHPDKKGIEAHLLKHYDDFDKDRPKEAVMGELLEAVHSISEAIKEYGLLGGLEKIKAKLDDQIELLGIEGLPLGSYFIEKSDVVPPEGKPFPTEHACRLEDPGKYDRFARNNCYKKSGRKCIDYIFGIKAGKSEVQALRYPKKIWAADDARKHCATHKGTFEAAGKGNR